MASGELKYVFGSSSEGEELLDEGSLSLGSFVQNTKFSFYVFIANKNSFAPVFIPSNGIKISGSGSFEKIYGFKKYGSVYSVNEDKVINLPYDILPLEGIFLKINIDTSVVGNKSLSLIIISNDATNSEFKYTFLFSVTAPSVSYPDIAILYNAGIIQQQSTVNVGKFAQESVGLVSFQIYNYAIPTLIIPQGGISVTSIQGNETVVFNPSESSIVNLSFNSSSTLTVSLDTISLGQKSFVVVVTSNDPDENPFVFTVIYEIVKPFSLEVQQSLNEVFDGDLVNLGSFNHKSIINKTITLENGGISYGIRVTDILVDGSAILVGLPSLPFVLEPNNGNSVQFITRFDSSVLGKRNASLRIQWEVSA